MTEPGKVEIEVEEVLPIAPSAPKAEAAPSVPKVEKKVRAYAVPAPSVPFAFSSKPSTTLILTFNRSLLEGKKGSDWEKLLKDAQIVQY